MYPPSMPPLSVSGQCPSRDACLEDGRKIISTFCDVLYVEVVPSCTHCPINRYEQLLQMNWGLLV